MSAVRSKFKTWLAIPTRWEDFDAYGHVNNAKYYAYFDSVINEYLMSVGGLNPTNHPVSGLVVESNCTIKKAFEFPEIIDAGLMVERIGQTSATYHIGLFREGEPVARAFGRCVHVFVTRADDRPTEIPESFRLALQKITDAG
jgi:acyl-CoA thioester hydrolase